MSASQFPTLRDKLADLSSLIFPGFPGGCGATMAPSGVLGNVNRAPRARGGGLKIAEAWRGDCVPLDYTRRASTHSCRQTFRSDAAGR
jgi:hypothetical protein